MVSGNVAAASRWLARIAHQMPHTIDTSVEDALDDLIRSLQPVTPVVSGDMQADYTIGHSGAGNRWELLDTAEAADGYPYPQRVFEDPSWSRAYDVLNQTLDHGIAALEADLDLAITRLIARPL